MLNLACSIKSQNCEENEGSLRVLHVLEDFSVGNTGVTAVVRQISQWQARQCAWVGVYATGQSNLMAPEGVHVHYSELNSLSGGWRYPLGGEHELMQLVRNYGVTVIHLHGLWRAAPIIGMRVALRAGLPTVLSVHGQTSPWALEGQGGLKSLKKKLYWNGFAKARIGGANVLHAITPLERQHMELFFGRRVATVIPNAIDLDLPECKEYRPNSSPECVIGFLGRLHPVKGVDTLIRAFSEASLAGRWRLLLAGPEEVPAYADYLRGLAASSSRSAQIEFCGPLYGQQKTDFLQRIWVLAAPSHTEVIGMVNLEAANLCTPSITTHETGLVDWEAGGGMLVSPEVVTLQAALEKASCWSEAERLLRGQASHDLVKDHYSLDVVGRAWLRLYRKLHTGCDEYSGS
jgi:glycosyltransferase involved in cell wall biosynthesis